MTKQIKMKKNTEKWKIEKIKKMKKILKEIITKSVQKDDGATFVRIRNSHEANGPFSHKRSCDQEPDRP